MRCALARRSLLLVTGAFVCLALPAMAAPITIDDFSTPNPQSPFVISLLNTNPTSGSWSGPGILGGTARCEYTGNWRCRTGQRGRHDRRRAILF